MYNPGANQYPGQNYSGVASPNYSGVSAASVALGSANAQASYLPSYANFGGQTSTGNYSGGQNVTAASIAMSNLPQPTTNNPYNKTPQNFGNQGNNQYGNHMNSNSQPQGNFGNQNQYSATQNYGNNMNQGNTQYGNNTNQSNFGNQGNNQYGNHMNSQPQGNFGNQNQYSATQNYGNQGRPNNQNFGNQNMNTGGMNQSSFHNQGGMASMQQANYGTSAFQNQFAMMQLQQQELIQQQRWFSQVDKDHNGTIDAAELAQLTFGGKPLSFEAAKKLLRIFDKDNNRAIDFAEYIALHKFIQAMQRAFNQTDFDRNGVLDGREIHSALQAAGFQLNAQACNALYHRYNKLNTGVDFVHFLEIAADVALLRVEFDKLDYDKDGVISVRFDELLSVVSNV